MTHKIEIKGTAKKQMRCLPRDILEQINKKIIALKDDPRPPGVKKVVGGLGWRIRVGDYRVIYTIDDQNCLVTICGVKPRQSAYK